MGRPRGSTKKVRQTTVEEFEEPVSEGAEVVVEPEAESVDPLFDFLQSIEDTRNYVLHVYRLPNYYRDGITSLRSVDRVFCTKFPFTVQDVEEYRGVIQRCYPQGGMFQLELRGPHPDYTNRIVTVKRWEEAIDPLPGYEQVRDRPGYPAQPIIVNQPQREPLPQAPLVSPAEMMREHMSLAKDMVSMAKDLMPPAQPININGGQSEEKPEEKPLLDRVLETLVIKAVEKGDSSQIDKVINALAGRNSQPEEGPGFWQTIGPAAAEIFKGLAPIVSDGIKSWKAGQQPGSGQPNQLQQPQPGAQQPPQQLPQVDPADLAWRQVIYRMLDDCADDVNTMASAERIARLCDRFPQFTAYVDQLLVTPAEGVLDLCATVVQPEHAPRVQALKQIQAALGWIEELKQTVRQVRAEDEQQRKSDEVSEPEIDDL